MTKFITPIYDRTLADISSRTPKAFFNVADWRRVYGNSQIVNDLLFILFGNDVDFDTLTEPVITTIPTVTAVNTMLENIERVRLACGLPTIAALGEIKTDWAEGSAADAPDYIDANQWEEIINAVFVGLGYSVEYLVYCGVANVGQPRFYQHRFRQFQGWVKPVIIPLRMPRTGVAAAGQSLLRQNRFRGFTGWVNPPTLPTRKSRMNVGNCGAGLQRQFGYRRYA